MKLKFWANIRKKAKKKQAYSLDKRQKIVIAVNILSICLFLIGYLSGLSGILTVALLGAITVFALWLILRFDLNENSSWTVFILPFLYSIAFGLFYFLVPARLSFRLLLTLLYALGLYSLFLSENVFVVASIRTIALLSGARIVSFILTLLTYFFLSNTVFSLHVILPLTVFLIALYTYPLIRYSLWTYDLQALSAGFRKWGFILTICLLELASVLWFWPSSPTVIALFLTGFFYTIVGLSHVWMEKRLFRGVLWEYIWVGAIVFFVLILFTQWGK